MKRWLLAFFACVAPLAAGGPAAAQSALATRRCDSARARARSDAALLFGPELVVQALHVPLVGDTSGAGAFVGSGYQVRASLGMDALDLPRGVLALDLAAAECARARSFETLEDSFASSEASSLIAGPEARVESLSRTLPALRALVRQGEVQLAEGLWTREQVTSLRSRVGALVRERAGARAEIARLRARDEGEPTRPQEALERHRSDLLRHERVASELRRLSAWHLNVRVGAIPVAPMDWYGVVELSWDFGGIALHLAEDEYLDARRRELWDPGSRAQRRVERFEADARARLTEARDNGRSLRTEIEVVDAQIDALEGADTAAASFALAMTRVRRAELAAELAAHEAVEAALLRLLEESP
ncbi:MAG TPA: hypothetical protein RMH99_03745 [Sandaracinaceae bacterium LLY-WYZ-13_1]|nr:hypothetical protein [Sandaracinaceae bacterium LLY-WYZ-13_1]